MMSNAIACIGLLCIRFANGFSLLLLGRILIGYANGSEQVCSSPYTGEICDPNIRKFTGTFGGLFYTLGYAIMYLLGAFFHWRDILSVIVIWPILCVLALILCPESPTWLMIKGKTHEAKATMMPLRRNSEDTTNEIKRIEENIEKQSRALESMGDVSYTQTLYRLSKQGTFLRPFLLLTVLMSIGMQYTGAPPLAFYLVPILQSTNIPISSYTAAALLASYRLVIVVMSTIVSSVVPRKPLLMSACFVVGTGGVILGTCSYFDGFAFYAPIKVQYPIMQWMPIMSIFLMYTGFSGGLGPVIFTLVGELLPSNLRSFGCGLVSASSFVSLFLVIKLTPFLQKCIGLHGMYWLFSGVAYCLIPFTVLFIPETFGKSLEDIEDHYRQLCHKKTANINQNIPNLENNAEMPPTGPIAASTQPQIVATTVDDDYHINDNAIGDGYTSRGRRRSSIISISAMLVSDWTTAGQ